MVRVSLIGLILSFAISAFGAKFNLYDSTMNDCLDYGHSDYTDEEYMACHDEAEKKVLSDEDRKAKYLDCLECDEDEASFEQKQSCLRRSS